MICPNCDAQVPDGARACKECGSDERTGWAENASHYGMVSPEPAEPPRQPARASRFVKATVALVAFVLLYVMGGLLLLVAGVAVAAGALAWSLVRKSPRMQERDLERELARRARGDAGLPQRLIDYELKKRPGLTRKQAIEIALTRLQNDRR